MKPVTQQVDLKQACSIYSDSVQKALHGLFDITLDKGASTLAVDHLERHDDLYFSILFTGQIYGEFLIGINKKTALALLGFSINEGDFESYYSKNRGDVIDSFMEVINIAAGTTLGKLKENFPDLSITPPKAIEGSITLSSYQIEKTKLTHTNGSLSCYIYIDYMKLEITAKQEELRRLNKAKSEFLANMSHELRTPLNGMIGMLDILKDSKMSMIQKEQFQVIYSSGEFLLSLINDILEFSKIESGKLEVELKPFDLRKAVDSVAENLASVVFAKGLDFHVYIDPMINGNYKGDETRLKQVLVNLLGNAIKFTPTGCISVVAESTKENNIRIRVSDTGIGIPKNKLESIFNSFTQVDASDNRRYGGTGLGLTISKSIIKAMGGSIHVQSEEAKGAEFTIEIPLPKEEATPSPAWPFLKLKGKNIWILTEEENMRQCLESYLGSFHPSNKIRLMRDAAEVNKGDVLIVDFRYWNDQRHLLEQIKPQDMYCLFLLAAKEQAEFDQLQKKQSPYPCYVLNRPVSLANLKRALDVMPVLNESNVTGLAPVRTVGSKEGSKKKVLVVEDNKINQVVIATMLKQLDYEIEMVDDGEKAVKLIEQRKLYDLILMDCQMPVMNGYEATRAIRDLETKSHTHIPIIALTANAFRETKEECFDCGMDDFATKPIKFEALKNVMQRTLQKRIQA